MWDVLRGRWRLDSVRVGDGVGGVFQGNGGVRERWRRRSVAFLGVHMDDDEDCVADEGGCAQVSYRLLGNGRFVQMAFGQVGRSDGHVS